MIIAKIGPGNTGVTDTRIDGEIIITLFDAATGQPVNGNNVTVTYTQNINGYVTEGQVIISGQSASVYHGEISNSDPANFFFTKFQIENVSEVPVSAPPVNFCDLKINYVHVDNPESAPGASDGQITVNASSSYGPISYSLDNVTFQVSPIFSGLTGGLKTVYVTDPNGCNSNTTITLPVLTSLLVSDASVNLGNGNISRWNAAFNPIVFTYQRKDFEVTAVELDTLSGNAAVSAACDTVLIANTIAANNRAIANAAALGIVLNNNNPVYVYLSTPVYSGTFNVSAISSTGKLVLDTPFVSNATGYININLLRPYYQIHTKITYPDPISGQTNSIVSTNRPDNTGRVKCDISNFLQSHLHAKDGSNFSQINYRDTDLSASYQVAYAEYWDGKLTANQTLTYIPIADPYYVVYAAKQLGQRYGGNLAQFVPFKTVTDNSQLAQWVTDFAEPAYSNGYPFDIGFIYSDDLVGLQLYCELTQLDINRVPLPGGPQTTYILNDDNSWLLNQDGSKLIIANQTSSNTTVPGQLGLNRLLVNENFDRDVYYFTIILKYNDQGGIAHPVTQTQTIRVDDAVDEQSVYLRWIGLSGSWNYYRFVFNQEVTLDVQNAVIIKKYVSDWENQDGIEEVIGKSAGQKIKVVAEDISVSDIKGLQSIKYSPKVQMLINKNPVKWQTIVLNTATFTEYETINGRAPFSVTFNLPAINIQTQ
ncbi:MAG TPA: hypothetical protein VNW95_10730 [Mucilaginibacter sp.]|jgi:hypothetical protein|nr:hypothetical protein [Mucilaginibacter sp.]